jgi:hypothetical protein
MLFGRIETINFYKQCDRCGLDTLLTVVRRYSTTLSI